MTAATQSATRPTMTVEAFDTWVLAQTDTDHSYEWISGEISEVVSNSYASTIAGNILAELRMFAKKHKLGRITGADGGYRVNGERYIPDVGFISYQRQPEQDYSAYNPLPPDLAVEVISNPANSREQSDVRRKLMNYLVANTTVWVVDPHERTLEVFRPDYTTATLTATDTLQNEAVLPGFVLKLSEVFTD